MLIRCGYQIGLHFDQPTAVVTMLAALEDQPRARILHELRHTSLQVRTTSYTDSHGNRCQRFTAPAGLLILEDRKSVV